MKQVLQDRNGLTVVREVPVPPCPPGSVLVRNAYSVISSGTEGARVALAKKSLIAKARARPDLVREVITRARREGIRSTYDAVARKLGEETAVGYSSAGVVLEVGEAVAGLRPGERVACAGGDHANHAEVVSVPANLCARVPEGVQLEVAALTTLASIAMHGIRLAGVQLGDRVAVIGCGLIGRLACRLLQAAGAEVFAVDVDPVRVDEALAGGAAHGFVAGGDSERRIVATAGGVGVDATLVTAASGSNDPLLLASAIARDRAAVVVVGDVPIELPRDRLYAKELSLRVSRSYGPGRGDDDYEERGLDYPIGFVRWTEGRNMAAVLDLLSRGSIEFDDLIEEIVPVEQAADAYARLTGGSQTPPRGAIVLAYPLPDQAHDEPTRLRPPPDRVASSSDRRPAVAPRIALIGPGSFAQRILVPALRRGGARLELVAGGTGPSAEAAVRRLGFARLAATEDDALADSDVDAVVIATRHGSHADLAARALQEGKHVFCEKPLAVTLEELERVLAAAESAPGILAVGFNRRFSPMLNDVREFVGVGENLIAQYRVSAGALDSRHWLHDLAEGGGRIIGESCHFIDALSFVAGSRVESVYAVGYADEHVPLQATENVVITLRFETGAVGIVAYAADGSPRLPKERLEVFSGSRTAVIDDYRTVELLGPSRRVRRRRRMDKGHDAEIKAFLGGIERGEPPVPLGDVANVSLATLAVVESLRSGRPVRLERESTSG